MADLTHDTADDAFHEIQLSGKQLVFLFMATTVVSVIIFICGVLVGRSVPAEGIADDGPAPLTTDVTRNAPDVSQTPATTPPSPAGEAPAPDYTARLGAEKGPPEQLKPQADTRSPEPAARTAEPPPVATPEPPPARPAAETRPAGAAPRPQPGAWAVQVVSLKDRGQAEQIVQRLQTRSYPAFLVSPAPGTPTQLYKVQVGRYKERAEAERIQDRLKKEEQFVPWIVRF